MRYVPRTIRLLLAACIGGLCLFAPQHAHAISAEYQLCVEESSCTIGEFLYNDDYSPIADAACTYTVRRPDGVVFLNAVSMTPNADGWYSYNVNTVGATAGLYRGTICCTPIGEEQLCLEKSFVVGPADLTAEDVENAVWDATRTDHDTAGTFGENLQNPSSISAADIWSYPSRSLTTFGSLVGDIWSNSSRTLSSFGDLVSNIWSNSTRTITGGTSSSSTDSTTITTINTTTQNISTSLTTISQEVAETRALLEQLINQPTIQTFLEDAPSESLESKLQRTETTLLRLQDQSTRATNTTDLLVLTWSNLQPDQLTQRLTDTVNLLGKDPEQPSPETMVDNTVSLTSIWNSFVLSSLSDQAQAALVSASTAQELADDSGKTQAVRQSVQETSKFLATFRQLLGSPEDTRTRPTAFGYLRELQAKAQALHEQERSVEQLLADWGTIEEQNRSQLLSTLSKEVMATNQLPRAETILSPAKEAATPGLRQKNTALGLQALVRANKQLLANRVDESLKSYWLEEGSVILRFLITNPSSVIEQEIPVKYYFPQEVLKEHILNIDDGLTVNYDIERNAYYVAGTYTLAPEETQTLSVEIEDIWQIQEAELTAMKKQAAELLSSIEKTSYFAQGALLKSDIDVSVDKILLNQSVDRTPDARIRAFRENQIELLAAKENMETLKGIVSSASATGSIFGFVGSIQVVAVWGIVIVLLAGFTYLVLYMKAMRSKLGTIPARQNRSSSSHDDRPMPPWKKGLFASLFFLLTGAVTSAVSSAYLAISNQPSPEYLATTRTEEPAVLGADTELQTAVLLGAGTPVPIYVSASEKAEMLHRIPEDIFVQIKSKRFGWVQIKYTWGSGVYIGWVQQEQLKLE